MNERSKTDKKIVSHEKLVIDKPDDFPFQAAFLKYSEIFDRVKDVDVKQQLNRKIVDLSKGKIDYKTFYTNINQFQPVHERGYSRSFIKTQRKRDYKRETKKRSRNLRHKK